ncbi:MAG: aminotransferase class I/II-fold pyridoxal phosphate-dependent enzyme [Beijerinckiaceae bacterium]|nr:aminotransferase class I/II-fold pyridoxal phosphate-dependent enzyme [Beijerinckiaceae bacterium]
MSSLLQPSRRSAAVSPFIAMDVMAEAGILERAGRAIAHMEVGQPGAPAPRLVREAAKRALEDGRIGYTEALGMMSLRERIARHYADHYGIGVPVERVVVTTGSSGAFILAFLAMFDPGARVAISAPGYPAYRNTLAALGLEPVDIETHAAGGWVLTPEAVEMAHRDAPLAGVLAMSPANPSGTMMDRTQLEALAKTCRRLGIWFISDEIYHGLAYEKKEVSALAVDDNAVIINSFSKYYCMTGWRVGWMILPEILVRPIERLAQSLYISVPKLSQIAAEAAFDATEELEIIKAGYAKNRALLLKELPRIGITELLPCDGAFYAYADISRFTNDSMGFCKRLLEEQGIAGAPGPDFDPVRGHKFMRLSFAGTYDDCLKTVEGLERFLKG